MFERWRISRQIPERTALRDLPAKTVDDIRMSQRYEIREQIGKGGLGAVYKAFDTQLHREVAMKRVLTTEHATEEEVQVSADKLIAEAKTLSTLNHPNIVTVFDVGQDEKGGFVVMELLKGETLDETVARGVLTQEDFIEIVYQTMEALISAQASDVIHRDLKPTNVMVIWQPSGKFQTKILDFGLAKFSKAPSVQTMDQEDAVMGSIYFMAPEQFERSELDARTDLYQIGCVYYHALTGQYPFRGETAPQVMNAHLQHRVTSLDKLRPDLSPSICQWVMWLINREMENRPANSREALERFPRNPEPPNAEPVLQAIPVEETPPTATTGVQVVLPSHSAKPPTLLRTHTGSAPVARAHTGSTPVRGGGARGARHTSPIRGRTGPISSEPEEKNRKPLFITLAVGGLVLAGFVGFLVMKSAHAKADHSRLVQLAEQEAPTGTAEDVALAIKFLESSEASGDDKNKASQLLTKVTGSGVDAAIISALETSPSQFVRLNLAKAAGERGMTESAAAMMSAFRAAGTENQKTEILNAVRRVATQENMPVLLDSLNGSHSLQVRTLFEDIVIAVFRREPHDPKQTSQILARAKGVTGEERSSLFRILGALGTDDVMIRLRAIFSTDSEKALRADAITALLNWPDRSALPMVEQALINSDNNVHTIAAGRAYARLASLPAAVPVAEKLETWQKGLGFINRPLDTRPIFSAMAELPAPEVKAFLQDEVKNPSLASLAKQAVTQIDRIIKEAPELGSGDSLTPAQATIGGTDPQGAVFNQSTGSLTGWRSPDTWFTWYFKVKEAGNYGVTVNQSYPREGKSQFEVIIGDQGFMSESQHTASASEFSPVKIDDSVALEAGKVYPLVIRARGITQPRMMDISGVLLEKR
ncbi:MAG: serine/threonine protein kinase [Verrucomicrobiae bacterium]|nr:serine/threonine protein kinase [Verrucomicrobiae bacterium]